MTPEEKRQEQPAPPPTSDSRLWIVRVLRELAGLITEFITFILVLTLFRIVEVFISILLLIIGVSVVLAVVFLFQSSGASLLAWCVIALGLPIEILLFKRQFDSEVSTFEFVDKLKLDLREALENRKRRE